MKKLVVFVLTLFAISGCIDNSGGELAESYLSEILVSGQIDNAQDLLEGDPDRFELCLDLEFRDELGNRGFLNRCRRQDFLNNPDLPSTIDMTDFWDVRSRSADFDLADATLVSGKVIFRELISFDSGVCHVKKHYSSSSYSCSAECPSTKKEYREWSYAIEPENFANNGPQNQVVDLKIDLLDASVPEVVRWTLESMSCADYEFFRQFDGGSAE